MSRAQGSREAHRPRKEASNEASNRDCLFAPDCEKKLKPGSSSPICSNCRSGRYYWKHKPLRYRLKRSKQLRKLQARLTTLLKGDEK